MAISKTNAMRILDTAKVTYNVYTYESNGEIDGHSVAKKIGKDETHVFKTLVTCGSSKNYFVFVIPVAKELNLKAAAASVGEKSVEMIKVADINKITGYIRGGCSPIGMKKQYQTVIDVSCMELESMIVSAGKIGQQIELSPTILINLLNAKTGCISA